MEEVIKFLNENHYGFLATVDNGRPRVRPMGFMFEEEGRLYFSTDSRKPVYRQLTALPYVEYSTTSKNMVTVRITGEVKFSEEISKKDKILSKYPMLKHVYQSADNPIFKVFYIEHGTTTISDFAGNSPKKVEF